MSAVAPRNVLAVVLCMALAGCAAPPQAPVAAPVASENAVPREALLSGAALFGNEALPPLPDADILGLDDDMRAFLARFVDLHANAHLRLQQLVYAVISPATFGLQYTDDTRTAAETFHGRNGNCLSFTNLFVAFARQAGLKVSFQQIDIPPDWDERGDTLVLNRHINVLVDLGSGVRRAVDFNIDDFKTSYDRETVSDTRATAHYYSNVGVERLQARDDRAAFLFLREGIGIDPEFSPLWTNLGALYARTGHLPEAEASYLEALRKDPQEPVAISNLARVYERLGDPARAAQYRQLALVHRQKNPYFRFHEAREAFLARDYERALDHLDYAVRKKPAEDQFYFLRGIVHLQLGHLAQARADLAKAEAIAGDEQLKRNYHSKVELLLRDQQVPAPR